MSDISGKIPQRWLVPSVALNQFKPPHGISAGVATPIGRQRARYGFRIGDIGLLIGQDTNSEVLDRILIYPLPKAPIWLLGLINLRGNLLPVFDMYPILDLEHSNTNTQNQQRLLILGKGDKAVGIVIGGLPQLAATRQIVARLPPLPAALRPYITKAYAQDNTIWLEFDHAGFFGALSGQLAETTE